MKRAWKPPDCPPGRPTSAATSIQGATLKRETPRKTTPKEKPGFRVDAFLSEAGKGRKLKAFVEDAMYFAYNMVNKHTDKYAISSHLIKMEADKEPEDTQLGRWSPGRRGLSWNFSGGYGCFLCGTLWLFAPTHSFLSSLSDSSIRLSHTHKTIHLCQKRREAATEAEGEKKVNKDGCL